MIAIVDYGVGNLYSLTCSLRHIGAEAVVTREEAVLRVADKVILPGVGAFGDAAEKLRSVGADRLLKALAGEGKPLLGVCLGMQLLFDKSLEYGEHEGLGLIPGIIRPLNEAFLHAEKVPHMGWNGLQIKDQSEPMLTGIDPEAFVYYVHSYYAADCESAVKAWSEYGGVRVPGIVRTGNVCGTQFHPEKSGDVGLRILANFAREGGVC